MSLAVLVVVMTFSLLAAACQAKAQPVKLTAGPTATAIRDRSDLVTEMPVTGTAPKPPDLSTPSISPETGVTEAARVTTTLPAPSDPAEPPPTSTPPQIADGLPAPPTVIPTAVDPIAAPDGVTNIILAGNDVRWPQGGRTDALLIVSIDRENQRAAILSLPRDLYVYIPGWTMNRINLALPHGHGVDYPGGGGGLLADTIEYNFGLPIDHYARIGFDGFSQVVDALGGVEVVVNCPLTDWRLKSPDLDPEIEDNWERYTLNDGLRQLDGELALWYARSRRSTNDFDRGRRQQQLVRAILDKGLSLGLVDDIPELWRTLSESIETDLSLPEILALAALAPAVHENGVRHLALPPAAFKAWRVPVSGEAVQLLQWQAAEKTFEQLVQPPALHRGERPVLTVEVVTGDEVLFRQAAENLAWSGLQAVHRHSDDPPPSRTQISANRVTLKGSQYQLVAWLFGLSPEEVTLSQARDEAYDYRVELGRDFNPCLPELFPPADLFAGHLAGQEFDEEPSEGTPFRLEWIALPSDR
jgi:LCP family protein required for cell wall assembly